jgi:LacI family transcriptional regulator
VANSKGAHDATAHLIAHGHHRIAFLGDRPSLYTADERTRGYLRALREVGLQPDPAIQWRGQADPEPAAAAILTMLELPDPPTAVFAGNNFIAVGVLEALGRAELLGRIAVVGFDDHDLASIVDPPLTVISQDPEAIGRIAAEGVFQWLDGAAPTRDVVVPVRLIARGSGEIAGPFRAPADPALSR